MRRDTGTRNTLGQDDIGHPQERPIDFILAQFCAPGEDFASDLRVFGLRIRQAQRPKTCDRRFNTARSDRRLLV